MLYKMTFRQIFAQARAEIKEDLARKNNRKK